jgi:hypothetical protein
MEAARVLTVEPQQFCLLINRSTVRQAEVICSGICSSLLARMLFRNGDNLDGSQNFHFFLLTRDLVFTLNGTALHTDRTMNL